MRFARRWLADAHRFGFTPEKLLSRLSTRQGPRILANSLPKAGTHLLERALSQHRRLYRAPVRTLHRRSMDQHGIDLVDRIERLGPNQFLVAHLEYSPDRSDLLREHEVRTLFIVRDPRDIAVSQAHFIGQKESHAHNALFAATPELSDRIALAIKGSPAHGFTSLRQRLEAYAPWLDSDVLVVRFEDLVGGSGGGDDDRQKKTLSAIFTHVGLELATGELDNLAARVFSTASPTFRRGATGQWQTQFDDRAIELFNTEVGDLAIKYGYSPVEPIPDRSD